LVACSATEKAPTDPRQTIRDSLFYDGLAAFHEGFYKEAAVRWSRASAFGDGEAARNLGHLYRQGLGVERDLPIAIAWYQVAADAGVTSAWYNLGMLYYHGAEGYPPNREQGLAWLTRAAEAGIAPAKAELERIKTQPPAPPPPEPAPPPPEPQPAPPPPAPPPAPETEKLRVQVGSYRSRALAEADIKRLQSPGVEHQLVEVRVKDQGLWYRLMAVGEAERLKAYCAGERPRVACWPGRFGPAFKK
jgi:TPR repeat protein